MAKETNTQSVSSIEKELRTLNKNIIDLNQTIKLLIDKLPIVTKKKKHIMHGGFW